MSDYLYDSTISGALDSVWFAVEKILSILDQDPGDILDYLNPEHSIFSPMPIIAPQDGLLFFLKRHIIPHCSY